MKITIDLDGLTVTELGHLASALSAAYYDFSCNGLSCETCSKRGACHTLRSIAAQALNACEDAVLGVQK